MSEIKRWDLCPACGFELEWEAEAGCFFCNDCCTHQDNARVMVEAADHDRRVTELETTLRSLRNEGYAILALSSDEIKQSAGYTNLKCFEDRLSEATQALLNAPKVRD